MPPRNKTAVAVNPNTVTPVVNGVIAPVVGNVTGFVGQINGVAVDPPPAPEPEKVPKVIVYADPIEPLDKVVYPFVSVTICGTPEQHGMQQEKIDALTEALKPLGLDGLIGYSGPLTAVDAMALIGWEVQQKGGPVFREYDLKDYFGNKVRLHKNIRNRPIYQSNIESLLQDILMGRYELNGEPLIVSDLANDLDGQHTLCALILAQQRLENDKVRQMDGMSRENDPLKWAEHWPDMVVSIPKIIVYGIKGTDKVVNTMNTGKPRTFMDVLYRSPYFSDLPTRSKDGLDRETAAKVTDHAVREVWQRTGLYSDGYSSRRTNSEGSAWLESHGGMHGKFLECVRLILEEDTHGHISKYLPCGKAVCLMWLGAAGKSDQMKYYVTRNEDKDAEAYMSLKWNHWKLAASFWKEFGDREPDKIVNQGKDGERTIPGKARGPLKSLTELLDSLNESDEPMVREKDFLIARAWNLWIEEKPITASIKITDKDYGDADGSTGVRQLIKKKHQRFGNIDLGMDRIKAVRDKELTAEEQAKTKSEIEAMKAKVAKEKEESEGPGEDKPTNGATTHALGSVKPQAQLDCEALAVANPDVHFVFVQTLSGKCEMWGANAPDVGRMLGVTASQHPNDSYYLKFDSSDWEMITNKLVGNGFTVGLGGKVEDKLEMLFVSRPKAKK